MSNHYFLMQIVKSIDAVAREQLVQIMAILGVGNAAPIFSMVPAPFKPAAFLPTITEEDKVILNNVQKVAEFLTAGTSLSSTSTQVLESSYDESEFNYSLTRLVCGLKSLKFKFWF